MGFEEPSPIQKGAIPMALEGEDLIGQAQTGTGKTAAFGIPIIQKINEKDRHIQALVMSPTRELCIQVADEISKIGKTKRIRVLPVYGGQPHRTADPQPETGHPGSHRDSGPAAGPYPPGHHRPGIRELPGAG